MKNWLLLLFACGVVVAPARADLTWTLDNVVFNDGGTASGFVTWIEGGTFDWSISVAGGNTADLPAFTFNPSDSVTAGSDSIVIILGPANPDPRLGQRAFLLSLASPSPTSGPTSINLLTTGPAVARDCWNCNPWRTVTSGSVDITGSITSFDPFLPISKDEFLAGVPEPGGLLWFAPIIGLFVRRHKKTARIGRS